MEHIKNIVKTVFREIQRRNSVAGLSGPELLALLKAEIKARGLRRQSKVRSNEEHRHN
jgi:hypothetical protein